MEVERLDVEPVVVAEVAEHERPQVVLVHLAVAVAVVVAEQVIEVVVKVPADRLADELDEPGAVAVVHQAVVEYAQRLVHLSQNHQTCYRRGDVA